MQFVEFFVSASFMIAVAIIRLIGGKPAIEEFSRSLDKPVGDY